ncbi:hypothetical protein FS749_004315, partial [Ceratobasidium sp. UAMH 11750]
MLLHYSPFLSPVLSPVLTSVPALSPTALPHVPHLTARPPSSVPPLALSTIPAGTRPVPLATRSLVRTRLAAPTLTFISGRGSPSAQLTAQRPRPAVSPAFTTPWPYNRARRPPDEQTNGRIR